MEVQQMKLLKTQNNIKKCELYNRLIFQMALIYFFTPVGNCVNSLPATQIGNKNGTSTTKIQ